MAALPIRYASTTSVSHIQLADSTKCTGFAQHPTVTEEVRQLADGPGTFVSQNKHKLLTADVCDAVACGLRRAGGYHRSHG